jgi:hypothetical protein
VLGELFFHEREVACFNLVGVVPKPPRKRMSLGWMLAIVPVNAWPSVCTEGRRAGVGGRVGGRAGGWAGKRVGERASEGVS